LVLTLSLVRRRQRPSLERCVKCGYNLRGNVSGVCSECGTPINVSKSETEIAKRVRLCAGKTGMEQ